MPELAVVKFLREKNVPFRLITLKAPAMTVADVTTYAQEPVNVDEICKTIITRGKSGKYYGVFLVGIDKVDWGKLKQVVGENIEIAKADEVLRVTGTELGAVCAVLLKIPLYVDQRVLDKEKVNFGSGDLLHGLEMSPKDLVTCMNSPVVDIAKT